MAERRMFAKTIVLSDAFLDMPLSARCLYFTLGMLADDDGFVNSPKSIMRQCGASEDDLKLLCIKKYVLAFDDGVIVIKHWRINNYLRNDRHTDTKYGDHLSALDTDENNAYRSKTGEEGILGIPHSNQVVGKVDTQYRLGKDREDKDSKDTLGHQDDRVRFAPHQIEQEFEQLWKLYPRKKGKEDAYKAYCKARKEGESYENVESGLAKFAEEVNRKGTLEKYIPYGSSWFHQRRWKDDYAQAQEFNWEEGLPF